MGLVARWRRWRAYHAAMAVLLRRAEAGGHQVSPPSYERIREEARRMAR